MFRRMRHMIAKLALVAALLVGSAAVAPARAAECYADYKAKQDSPLRLHYGVAKLSGACTPAAARAELTPRLARQGWTLLNVLSTFGPEKLEGKRANAAEFFLRF